MVFKKVMMSLCQLKTHLLPFDLGVLVGLYLLLARFPPTRGLSVINSNFKPELRDMSRNSKLLMGLQNMFKDREMDPLSPQGSWFLFNENDANQKKKNRKRKCKRCDKNTIPMPKTGPVGPPGPRGPQGPQGQAGGMLSLTEIENYINVYLADILLKNQTLSSEFLFKKRKNPFKEDVPVVFTAKLPRKEVVPSLKASVIKGFTVTFGPGQFKRGVIVKRGRFMVTKSGVYQVSGTIPFQRKNPQDTQEEEKSPSLYLCVDNCISDRRIRWSASLESRTTTAVVNGHVRLKRGQSLMVLLSNPTRSDLEVLSGATFSAALIGT